MLETSATHRTERRWTICGMERRRRLVEPSGDRAGLSVPRAGGERSRAGDRATRVGADRCAAVELAREPTARLAFSAVEGAPSCAC